MVFPTLKKIATLLLVTLPLSPCLQCNFTSVKRGAGVQPFLLVSWSCASLGRKIQPRGSADPRGRWQRGGGVCVKGCLSFFITFYLLPSLRRSANQPNFWVTQTLGKIRATLYSLGDEVRALCPFCLTPTPVCLCPLHCLFGSPAQHRGAGIAE